MPALLDEIIALATDGKQPLADILRKCLLLGYELSNDRLKKWANQELDGYERTEDLPEYRRLQGHAKGHFVGPFGITLNYPIAPAAVEKRHETYTRDALISHGVSVLEGIVSAASEKRGTVCFPWPPNVVVYYRQKLIKEYVLVTAELEVPESLVAGVLDTIRNRTLNMALEIRREIGDTEADLRKIEPSRAEKIEGIIIHNTGGNVHFSIGQTIVSSTQAETVVNVVGTEALKKSLSAVGLDKQDFREFSEAVKTDGGKPGPSVGQWIKDKAPKVLEGGVKIGARVGAEILTSLIKQHCGLP